MSKTDITRSIEVFLRNYDPSDYGAGIKVNKFRDRHTAFEVPAINGTHTGGLIDCVIVGEYMANEREYRTCSYYSYLNSRKNDFEKYGRKMFAQNCVYHSSKQSSMYGGTEQWYSDPPEKCSDTKCRHNYLGKAGTPEIFIACYEIKVTKSDFNSKNGHNFVGHLNYYVMPYELYKELKDKIPEDIGVITLQGEYSLRRVKDSKFNELTPKTERDLLMSVMKRFQKNAQERQKEEYRKGYDCAMKDAERLARI